MSDMNKTTQIDDLRRRRVQWLDSIGQMRIRAQVAESYNLLSVSKNARSSIRRFEGEIVLLTAKLKRLGAE